MCEGEKKRQELLPLTALGTWVISEFHPERKQGDAGLELGNVSVSDPQLHIQLDVKLREIVLLLRLEKDVEVQ